MWLYGARDRQCHGGSIDKQFSLREAQRISVLIDSAVFFRDRFEWIAKLQIPSCGAFSFVLDFQQRSFVHVFIILHSRKIMY